MIWKVYGKNIRPFGRASAEKSQKYWQPLSKDPIFLLKFDGLSIFDFSQHRLVRLRCGWSQTIEREILYKTAKKK